MSGLLLLVIAYVSLAVFVAVAAAKSIRTARLPVHLRWELAPVPHEKGKSHYGGSYFEEYEWWTRPREISWVNEAVYMFQEIVFLKGVWEHNRRLWWFSFPFHFGLYLLIVAAAMAVLAAVAGLLGGATVVGGVLAALVLILGAAGYGLGIVGAAGLLAFRLYDPRLRPFRTGAALLNLGLLLAVFLSGSYALLAVGDFPERLADFTRGLFTADASVTVPGPLAVHLVLVFLFLAYLPFTQMLHFVAKYFTYHRVRWDDRAMVTDSRMEHQVEKLLQQPVTWSGAHLHADGTKNWVDIATEKEVNE